MGNKNTNQKIKDIKKEETKEDIPVDKEYIYEITDLNKSNIKKAYKIVILGSVATGAKTALLKRLTGVKFEEGNFDGKSNANINIKFNTKKETLFQFLDTPSVEQYLSLIKIFMMANDCVVIGYDITRQYTFDEVKSLWYPKAIDFKASNLIYLIGNKIDLNEQREVKKEEAIEFAKSKNLRFFEISCKTDEGIKEFFDDLVHKLIKQ